MDPPGPLIPNGRGKAQASWWLGKGPNGPGASPPLDFPNRRNLFSRFPPPRLRVPGPGSSDQPFRKNVPLELKPAPLWAPKPGVGDGNHGPWGVNFFWARPETGWPAAPPTGCPPFRPTWGLSQRPIFFSLIGPENLPAPGPAFFLLPPPLGWPLGTGAFGPWVDRPLGGFLGAEVNHKNPALAQGPRRRPSISSPTDGRPGRHPARKNPGPANCPPFGGSGLQNHSSNQPPDRPPRLFDLPARAVRRPH